MKRPARGRQKASASMFRPQSAQLRRGKPGHLRHHSLWRISSPGLLIRSSPPARSYRSRISHRSVLAVVVGRGHEVDAGMPDGRRSSRRRCPPGPARAGRRDPRPARRPATGERSHGRHVATSPAHGTVRRPRAPPTPPGFINIGAEVVALTALDPHAEPDRRPRFRASDSPRNEAKSPLQLEPPGPCLAASRNDADAVTATSRDAEGGQLSTTTSSARQTPESS